MWVWWGMVVGYVGKWGWVVWVWRERGFKYWGMLSSESCCGLCEEREDRV